MIDLIQTIKARIFEQEYNDKFIIAVDTQSFLNGKQKL